jgi:hypothetical protein
MANSYVDTVLPELLLNIEEVFMSKRHELTLMEQPKTAVAMLEKQTADVTPYGTGDGDNFRCTGFSVAYQVADQNTIGNGGAVPSAECIITPDQTFSGLKETYDIQRAFTRKMSILGKDCDNAIKFRERLASAMMVKMQEIALEINQWAIAFLGTSKQTATHAGDYGTLNAGVIEYPKADLLNQDKFELILADLHLTALEELLPASMYAVNGRNFAVAQYQSQFNAANDDQRSQALSFAAFPMYWDLHGFGPARANIAYTSFVIDPNAYVFLTRSQFSERPATINTTASTDTVFKLPLRYVDGDGTVKTMMHKENGVMVPVFVSCRLQYACDTVNAVDGFPTYNYVLEMSVMGDFKLAPNQASSTGIIEINAV